MLFQPARPHLAALMKKGKQPTSPGNVAEHDSASSRHP
jgi:hypothetical protein